MRPINKEGYYQMPQMEAVKPTVLPFLIIRAGYKPVIPEIWLSPSDRAKFLSEMPPKSKNLPDISGDTDPFYSI